MKKRGIEKTALLQNADGSVYHLNLHPEEVAHTIILVGDPSRVSIVSSYFDRIELVRQKREFVTHTGYVGDKRISVIATGIGIGNIDIVLNELDALVNVDLKTHTIKEPSRVLRIIRLGTSGSLSEAIKPDEFVVSKFALSFDGLLSFYQQNNSQEEQELLSLAKVHFSQLPVIDNAYVAKSNKNLMSLFTPYCHTGMTLTCPGFYGPQHRQLRIPLIKENILTIASQFRFRDVEMTNLEMETAAIYGLGSLLKHECCSISTIVANRITQEVSKDPQQAIIKMIEMAMRQLR